jgi:hypothetical protein
MLREWIREKSWQDQPLTCDMIDEKQHPAAKGLHRGTGCEKVRCGMGQLLNFFSVNSLNEYFARGKVTVECAGTETRLPGDVVHRDGCAMFHKGLLSRLKNARPVLLRVGSLLPRPALRW